MIDYIRDVPLYIIMLVPFDLHVWNAFCAVAAIYLWLCEQPISFDWDAWCSLPWYFKAFNASQICIFLLGSFFPERVGYIISHRHWAGNWPTSIWLLKKDAAAKMCAAVPMFGQPQLWRVVLSSAP